MFQAFRWKHTRKIISSGIIVYYYYKALFTAVYREKNCIFTSKRGGRSKKSYAEVREWVYGIIIFFISPYQGGKWCSFKQ